MQRRRKSFSIFPKDKKVFSQKQSIKFKEIFNDNSAEEFCPEN